MGCDDLSLHKKLNGYHVESDRFICCKFRDQTLTNEWEEWGKDWLNIRKKI